MRRRATPARSAAYHFTYMIPQANEEVLQRYNEKRVPFKAILPIGAAYPCSFISLLLGLPCSPLHRAAQQCCCR